MASASSSTPRDWLRLPIQHRAGPDGGDDDNHDDGDSDLALARFHELARGLDGVNQLVLFQVVTFLALHVVSFLWLSTAPGVRSLRVQRICQCPRRNRGRDHGTMAHPGCR